MKKSKQLDQYVSLVGEDILNVIYEKASKLRGLHILHINTTAKGGGVAEILEGLDPIAHEFGFTQSRKVIQLDESTSHFISHLVDMLQGSEPGEISDRERDRFLDWLGQSRLSKHDDHADVYVVHDYQLAPLAQLYPWLRPAIWFCHVDTAQPNPHAKSYIQDFLDAYELCVFNSAPSVFPEIRPERAHVMTLGIDPFRRKNAPLEHERGLQLLHKCGIDVRRPLITQVARFDRWKDPWQAVDAYRLVKQQMPEVQLAFVGAMEATDDKGAVEVLHDLQRYAGDDKDVHLLSDPAVIGDDEVNAFQRYSSVILQRSTREGFGLTATEAMWKNQPVIGTSATGLKIQLVDGENGYIVDDTQSCAERTLELLRDRDRWHQLGRNAHEHVRKHYLLPMMVLSYLDALEKVHQRSLQPSGVEQSSRSSDSAAAD
ncbi:trehalose synthase [Dictyobacter sp. S3.2.2.5]|uniref:Trehalose synthase n=1 Tax=Dictyobacter halimunensis TaxID=3026934 RepID=A0ABQ6FL03_9CHLR|nr:trehalose synthase [Dictyobacter sp. S3.2.2.5]